MRQWGVWGGSGTVKESYLKAVTHFGQAGSVAFVIDNRFITGG